MCANACSCSSVNPSFDQFSFLSFSLSRNLCSLSFLHNIPHSSRRSISSTLTFLPSCSFITTLPFSLPFWPHLCFVSPPFFSCKSAIFTQFQSDSTSTISPLLSTPLLPFQTLYTMPFLTSPHTCCLSHLPINTS